MFTNKLLKCAILSIIIFHYNHVDCKARALQNRKDSLVTSSHITHNDTYQIQQNVSEINASGSLADNNSDKKNKNKNIKKRGGFPASNDDDDDDYYPWYDDIFPASTPEKPECILEKSEFYLSWWINEDGSLRVSGSNRLGNSQGFIDFSLQFRTEDLIFNHVAEMTTNNPSDVIKYMSLAMNKLQRIPEQILALVSVSLQYLSLAGNNFATIFEEHETSFQNWTSFPLMMNLKELDLRNCSIVVLENDVFKNLPNLEKLFLSHNYLSTLQAHVFTPLSRLNHLDISYNEIDDSASFSDDPFQLLSNGLILDEELFLGLENLIFLDLSHTKLQQDSIRAFAHLRSKVEQLSLCYTEIPLIVPQMFMQTNLKVLDLSGNPNLTPNLASIWFHGLEKKLEILVFKNSNINILNPFVRLQKLRMLDLADNNINQLVFTYFQNFQQLEIVDLSNNHISNWYERVFIGNSILRIINLRSNNINLMTPEMMADFRTILFLAIGANNFVCDCSLRAFIDRAAWNAQYQQCRIANGRSKRSVEFEDPEYYYNVMLREYHYYIKYAKESYNNMIFTPNEGNVKKLSSSPKMQLSSNCERNLNGTIDDPNMNFDFLLFDYNENDYHCIETDKYGNSNKRLVFNEIASCYQKDEQTEEPYDDLITTESEQMHKPEYEKFPNPSSSGRNFLIIYISVCVPLTAIGFLFFWKRTDIRYFYAIFRNSLILSLNKDDKNAMVLKNRRGTTSMNDEYNYDVFVSYSDKDRGWVLDELIPNIEKRTEVTICLHERDFQVGLSILENIIQCMDQSRCLLLVVSESFLKSNWCAFEMHLAQHRLIETRREQLILVLLQDIPKVKRPRTLQYLMRTKTYIIWPTENKEELRNVFWKRLKKAIILNNWEPEKKSKGKPRHSVV